MKAYKIEILVIDFDEVGPQGIVEEIENARFPNDCISPSVQAIAERDIGEWDDSHPLNRRDKMEAEFKRLFGEAK